MISFSIQFHRGTCEVDVTEPPGEHADEEGPPFASTREIARINGDLPVLC